VIERLIRMSLLGQKPWQPIWLMRDEYLTDLGAGTVHGAPAEPGPGTRSLVDSQLKISASSRKLVISGGKTPAGQGDPAIYYPALTRSTGRAAIMALTRNTTGVFYFGYSASPSGVVNAHAFRVSTINVTPFDAGNAGDNVFILPSDGSPITGVLSLRSIGAFYITRLNDNPWTLQWVSAAGTQNPLHPACSSYSQAVQFDHMRACDLPAPFDTDYGLASLHLAGARQAGESFRHQADCLIELAVSLPESGILEIGFRRQDDDNTWLMRITPSGDFTLIERVEGTDTTRGNASGVVASGQRCVLLCNGETLRGYSNNVLRWTYSGAARFRHETGGIIREIGSGGAITNLVAWPRFLSGKVVRILEVAAKL
jgi:hypothetical protein